jgi:hypothetical protein
MTDLKNLKSIDLSSITTVGTAINFIWGIICSIIIIISISISSVSIGTFVLGLAILFAILIISIPYYFGGAYLYNFFINRLKDISLEITEEGELRKISIIPLAIMVTLITLIFQLIIFPIIYLIVGVSLPLLQVFAMQGLYEPISILLQLTNPIQIIYSIIASFIATAIGTFVYNVLVSKIGGIKLELKEAHGNLTQIDSINPISVGLIIGIICLVLSVIFSLILTSTALNVNSLIYAVVLIVLGFVFGLLSGIVTSIFYNFVVKYVGPLKVRLE